MNEVKAQRKKSLVGKLPKDAPLVEGEHKALVTSVAQGKKKVYVCA